MDPDETFRQRLLLAFRAEAEEYLGGIVCGLHGLEQLLSQGAALTSDQIEPIYRQFHSLKGASQAMGFDAVGQICQESESLLYTWKQTPAQAEPTQIAQLLDSALLSARHLDLPVPGEVEAPPSAPTSIPARPDPAAPQAPARPNPGEARVTAGPAAAPERAPSSPRPSAGEGSQEAAPVQPARGLLRVSSERLDQLLRQGEQLVLARLNSHQRWQEARRLGAMAEQLRELILARATGPGGPGQADLGPVEEAMRLLATSLRQHSRRLDSDRRELDGQLTAFLEEIKGVRLAPARPLLDELAMAARRTARRLDRQLRVQQEGGDQTLDRNILEAVKEPLLHLVRNALDHGLEPPEERRARGKDPEGCLRLEVHSRGMGIVEFRVQDDGRGVDEARVREASRQRGLSPAGDLLELLSASGLSTREEVNDISGRGLGMAIVKEKVEALRGTLGLKNLPGAGSTFTLTVPTSLATFQGLLLRERGREFILPLASVAAVARVQPRALNRVEGTPTVTFRGALVPVISLGGLLGLPAPPGSSAPETLKLVILSGDDRGVGLSVDEIVGSQEVLSRDLGPQLRRVRFLAGACLLGHQQLVPVLSPQDLLASTRRAGLPSAPQGGSQLPPLLLTVDDSLTTRTLIRAILESAGYRVRTASDGAQAWELLQLEPFDLVVSDVDMPGLTGLDLTARIRAHPRLGQLPVVLVTGQDRAEHREEGMRAGASAYILKGSFEEGALLQAVSDLVGRADPTP